MRWLEPAFRPSPDIEGLIHSGHNKFNRIDVKLGVAMTAMLKNNSDHASDLYLDVNRRANQYVRINSPGDSHLPHLLRLRGSPLT